MNWTQCRNVVTNTFACLEPGTFLFVWQNVIIKDSFNIRSFRDLETKHAGKRGFCEGITPTSILHKFKKKVRPFRLIFRYFLTPLPQIFGREKALLPTSFNPCWRGETVTPFFHVFSHQPKSRNQSFSPLRVGRKQELKNVKKIESKLKVITNNTRCLFNKSNMKWN